VYLVIAELQLDNKNFRAIYDDQVGCMIRLETDCKPPIFSAIVN
jgi:hypothetical protein